MDRVTVYTTQSLPQATLIQGFLSERGIESEMTQVDLAPLFMKIPAADSEIKIQVSTDQAELAIRLINEGQNSEEYAPPRSSAPTANPPEPFFHRPFFRVTYFLLICVTIILAIQYWSIREELSHYKQNEYGRSVYDPETRCRTDYWKNSDEIASTACAPDSAGHYTRLTYRNEHGQLMQEVDFKPHSNHPSKTIEYNRLGKVRDIWYDDDADGFYDRHEHFN